MRLLLLALVAALAACGTTQTSMPYEPTVQIQPVAAARPVVALLEPVSNERRAGGDDPTWVGTIRGGYGNPLKVLRADAPVEQVVARAFADGLAMRGLAGLGRAVCGRGAPRARRHHPLRGRRATADFSAALTERATGQVVWRDYHQANKTGGGFFSFALFSPVEEFRTLALRAMNEAVDALLDNPEFRAVLRRG